jgi:signal transduction histidine kinase
MTVHDIDQWRPASAGSAPSLRHDLRHELATVQALVAAAGDPTLDRGRIAVLIATAGTQVGQALQLLDELGAALPTPTQPGTAPPAPGARPVISGCDVEPVLQSAARASAASDRSITVSCAAPGRVLLPRTALVRVVGNLVRNAIAATEVGGTVQLRAVEVPRGSGQPAHLRVEVHDDGPGPGPDGFSRAGGVGLSVVRSLVLPAGGWLTMGRSPLGGACAAVTLPQAPSAGPW